MEGSGVQFRVAGEALIVPNDADVNPSAQKALEEAVQKDSVRAVGEEKKADYWIGERERNWTKGISGHLRATFARPTPGTPLDKVDRNPEEWTETMKPEGETVSIRYVRYSHARTHASSNPICSWMTGRAKAGSSERKSKLYPGGDCSAYGRDA
jgi:hypothetical protein